MLTWTNANVLTPVDLVLSAPTVREDIIANVPLAMRVTHTHAVAARWVVPSAILSGTVYITVLFPM